MVQLLLLEEDHPHPRAPTKIRLILLKIVARKMTRPGLLPALPQPLALRP